MYASIKTVTDKVEYSNSQFFYWQNSIKSIGNKQYKSRDNTTHAITTQQRTLSMRDNMCRTKSNKPWSINTTTSTHETSIAKKRVRFSPCDDTKIIESRQNMSIKEVRRYWWKPDEINAMKPNYRNVKRLYQNCGKNDCFRGLESTYWKMRTLKEADFRPDNKDFAKFVLEYLPPPPPFLNRGNKIGNDDKSGIKDYNYRDVSTVDKEITIYRHYVTLSEKRARILALMDEAFVKENEDSLTYRSEFFSQDDERWDYLRCCSCHVDKDKMLIPCLPNFDNTFFGKVMMGMRCIVVGRRR